MAEQQGSSSKAGEPSAANVFSGERSKEGYALTNAELFKLVDKVVYPGHADGDEVNGKQSEADRFAKAVCGTPASSGYTRVSTMRTKTNVKSEYDSLQEYQCATCKRNLAANLALRPPTEKMRVYIPGPEIPQSSSQKFKCEAVFTDIHAEQLEEAGYVQIEVNFHAPDLALEGFDPLKSTPPRKKKGQQALSVGTVSQGEGADAHGAVDNAVLEQLCMPPVVPGKWKGCKDLIAMMEEPFTLKDSSGQESGPFTPIYLWPRGNSRHKFGEEWKKGSTQDALSKLYQDYYNIKVRRELSEKVLREAKPDLFDNDSDPFAGDVAPSGMLTVLRGHKDLKRPLGCTTWTDAVLTHLQSAKGHSYKTPFT